MAAAFEITTQTSDVVPLDRRGRGEVKFLVTNSLGRSVHARLRAEPEGAQGARSDWLIVDKPEHPFAPGGATMITVAAGVPAGTPAGRYPFRLVVDAGEGGAQASSAPVWLHHQSSNRSLWAALVIGALVVAASALGVYRWLTAPPACLVERAVYDATGRCACPPGTVESPLGQQRICLCASGTDWDERSGTCVSRACEVENALYSEAADGCTCPPAAQEAQVAGRSKCVCAPGLAYDPQARACAPHPCDAPARSRYDERTGQCECPAGMRVETAPETGKPACTCPAGQRYDEPTAQCLTLPDLRVTWITVVPPLRMQRLFAIEVAMENAGQSPAGPFRLHVEATGAGVSFRDQMDSAALGPGQKLTYRSSDLRIELPPPLRVQARIEPLGYADGNPADNAHEQSFQLVRED